MAPLFFLLTLMFPLHLPVVYSQNSSSSERTILLSLKQHWGNPTSLHSWNSTSSPCDWPEIYCTSGAVIRLFLSEKNISGTMPPTMCQLENLVYIDLSKNNLSGHIPSSLYNCSNLEMLDLSLNSLSGEIPGELFHMKRVRSLYLHRNRLCGGISTPIEANSLEALDLSNNQLNGSIPDDIRNLYNLKQLNLSKNSFSGAIPVGLFSLRQLYYLSLGHNNLRGELPAKMGMSTLHVLNLAHNHFYGIIPRSLGKLPQLSALDLSDNQLSGDIVEDFLSLRSTNVIRLCSNKFLGKIPYELVNQNQHSNESCLDRSNVCSDNRAEGLPSCPSSLCSDDRVQAYLKCDSKNDKPKKHFMIFIVATVGCVVVGFPILYYVARKCWRKKHIIAAAFKKIWPCCRFLKGKEEEWKMIPFQKLKFKITDILSNLTEENQIGEGGGGKVYRVYINQINNAVAVKSISNARKSDKRLEKEFLAEIQTLGAIRHTNIVKLFCYISGKDLKLLVYQYFENMSLDQWLHCKRSQISSSLDNNNSLVKKLDWPRRLHIAIGAAQGLCYMHHDCNPPIIHRDIKPSNILLDSEFNSKIADFGLAKLLTRNGDTETASVVAGTFGYIAPEYAYTTKLNTKTDVYSFGVILLELTTGRKAVTQGDPRNLAAWAQMYYGDSSDIVEALDDEIKEPTYLDQITAVFRLGVICTATSPSNRPSMKDCLHILHHCSNNISSSSPMNLKLAVEIH